MARLIQHMLRSLGIGARRPLAPGPDGQTTPSVQRIAPQISIEGVTPVTAPIPLVKAFGLEPRHVLCAGVTADRAMTAMAAQALADVYREGGTRGIEAAHVANGLRALREPEALYFMLVRFPGSSALRLLAFVDSPVGTRD